ncbi:MAG: nitroreductase family deazaflavin-dependent oxidoreductase [Nocardioides sp.]|nr:nitroreductase family deazaflavin-dependent oxidoreductase [Nocardioides sp.]
MGLATDLGYVHSRPNVCQRVVQVFASTRPGACTFSKTLPRLDKAVGKVTRGRHSAPGLLAGLPVLDITTTGRKSGARRTTHLISIPVDDNLALLGTNFGQQATPAWVLNLEADPHASVTFRGAMRDVVARPADDDERAAVMANAAGIYGGYLKYLSRISGRAVRVFVLEPSS